RAGEASGAVKAFGRRVGRGELLDALGEPRDEGIGRVAHLGDAREPVRRLLAGEAGGIRAVETRDVSDGVDERVGGDPHATSQAAGSDIRDRRARIRGKRTEKLDRKS